MTPLALGALTASLASVALLALPGELPSPGATPRADAVTVARPAGVWPVQPPSIVNDFDDPPPYAPGHRGIDLAAATGQVVVAAAAGMVLTAGQVAGRSVVVVGHGDGVRTSYLPVSPLVRVGDDVRAGEPIGVVAASSHCLASPCLHWGARRGDTYLDPRTLLPLRSGPIVLLPVDLYRSH